MQIKTLLPLPDKTYADHSHPAYSKEAVLAILKGLGFSYEYFDEYEESFIVPSKPIDAKPKESVDNDYQFIIEEVQQLVFECGHNVDESGYILTNKQFDDCINLAISKAATKPQRITEQDAYEIIEAAFEIKGNKNVLFMSDFFENGGRKLLDKLNEHREPEAVPTSEAIKQVLIRAAQVVAWRAGDVSTEDGNYATTSTDAIIRLEESLCEAFNTSSLDVLSLKKFYH